MKESTLMLMVDNIKEVVGLGGGKDGVNMFIKVFIIIVIGRMINVLAWSILLLKKTLLIASSVLLSHSLSSLSNFSIIISSRFSRLWLMKSTILIVISILIVVIKHLRIPVYILSILISILVILTYRLVLFFKIALFIKVLIVILKTAVYLRVLLVILKIVPIQMGVLVWIRF